MRGAINSALAIAYGKDKGGFDTFLKTLIGDEEPARVSTGAGALPGIGHAEKSSGGMSEWEEMG